MHAGVYQRSREHPLEVYNMIVLLTTSIVCLISDDDDDDDYDYACL